MEETPKTVHNSLSSVQALLDLFKMNRKELEQILNKGYRRYKKNESDDKFRWIEEPDDELKKIQKTLLIYLQETLICPPYCMAGFKEQNNMKNANLHRKKREVITMDISHCFPNTKAKYISKFFAEVYGATGEVLELLTALTTYNGYLPTGAPTSTLLLAYAHKEIFDGIYRKMKALDVDMSVYVDDITLSTHKHIGNWVIKYINKALNKHGVWLKKSKTKRFGYKHAVVTGVHIAQSGKMSPPFKVGHSVVKALKEKDLCQMTITELRGIIAKISYIQQFQPGKMAVTKKKAIRLLKRLQKTKDNTIK